MSDPDPLEEAKAGCLRYLARREYGSGELLQKLTAQGCDESVAREAIEQLQREGYQSDQRFIEVFVRARVSKGCGETRIRQELHYRGVDREATDACLRLYDWDELLGQVYERKYGQGGPSSPKERAARLRFLQQRGFSAARIGSLFRRLRHDDD